MLVLSRRLHEKILFPTIQAAVQVVGVRAGVVRLGIEAPRELPVVREELHEGPAKGGSAPSQPADRAASAEIRDLKHLLRNRLHIGSVGLALLRRQLQDGLIEDAETTLAKVQEEFRSLVQRLDDEERKPPQAAVPQPPTEARKSKALLVEDNSNECELLATFLRIAGVEVDTAGDGADALQYLRNRGRPDVVLLDMGLPRCDGPTTVREIRRDPSYAGLKIFAVTGHPREEFNLANGPAGVDRWFRKPVDLQVLLRDLNLEFDYALSRGSPAMSASNS